MAEYANTVELRQIVASIAYVLFCKYLPRKGSHIIRGISVHNTFISKELIAVICLLILVPHSLCIPLINHTR